MSDFPITRFGGLRLDLEPDEVGPNQAIDLLNVDFDKTGAVRVRDGHVTFATPGAGVAYTRPLLTHLRSAGNQVLTGGLETVTRYAYALDSSGALVARSASFGTTGSVDTAARIGSPTSSRVYVAGEGSSTSTGLAIQRWDGAAWTAPAGMPTPRLLAVTPVDFRLVAACTGATGGPAAAASSESHVWFSDAGLPETWGASNYVQFSPGDGEQITALVTWREQLYVFKQNRFWVLYNTSLDSTGAPEFDFRPIETGVGASWLKGAVAGPDGVYFAHRSGIYRTTGGTPERVSGALTPWFESGSLPFFTGGAINMTERNVIGMASVGHTILTTFQTDSAYITWAYRVDGGVWTRWQLPNALTAMATLQTAREDRLLAAASGTLVQFVEGTTTDGGTAIASSYRSGFYSPTNDHAQESMIRESIMDGIGSPSFSLSRDFATALPTSGGGAKSAVVLGTSPAIAQGRHRIAQRGRHFSYQLEASSGAWRVDSVTQNVNTIRAPGMKSVG